MLGQRTVRISVGISALPRLPRRFQHESPVSQLYNRPPAYTYGSLPVKKSIEQEYIHGPSDWAPQLRLAEPLMPCEPRDFNLYSELELSECENHPCIPPWWSVGSVGIPDYIQALIHPLQSGDWDEVAQCLHNVLLGSSSAATSSIFWEFLLWQAVRFRDVELAQDLVHEASKRLGSLQSKLLTLFSVVVAHRYASSAVKYFCQCDLSLPSKALVEYAAVQVLEVCSTLEEQKSVLDHFSESLSVSSDQIAGVWRHVAPHKLPRKELLCYTLARQNITLIVAYASALHETDQAATQLLLTTLAPRVLPPPKMRQLLSEYIVNELSRKPAVTAVPSATMLWSTFTSSKVKLSVRCTALLLKALFTDDKSPAFSSIFQVLSRLHCVDFSHATKGEIRQLYMLVGKAQAFTKNHIAAGTAFPPAVWSLVFNTLLPIDVLGTLKGHGIYLNLEMVSVMYGIEASDLKGRHSDMYNHSIAPSKLPELSKSVWYWSVLTSQGLHPLSCYVVVQTVLADLKRLYALDYELDISAILDGMKTGLCQNSLEAQFLTDGLRLLLIDALRSRGSIKSIAHILRSGVELSDYTDLLVAGFTNFRTQLPPFLVEQVFESLAPTDPMEATAKHAECAVTLWSLLRDKPGFVPTGKTLHHLLLAVAAHKPEMVQDYLQLFAHYNLPVTARTIFALASTALRARWVAVSCDSILNFGAQRGVQLPPDLLGALAQMRQEVRPLSGLQTMQAMLGVLKERVGRRKPGPS